MYGNDISEGFELSDVSARGALATAPVEVVGAEFVVRDAVAHDVVRDFEDLMADGDDGFLVTATAA